MDNNLRAILAVKSEDTVYDENLTDIQEIYVEDESSSPFLLESAIDVDAANTLNKAPDGGLRAWLVVIGTFLVHLTVDGTLNSFGLFLAAYTSPSSRFASTDPTVLSLIGSFAAGFSQIASLVTGRLAERFTGFRIMIALGNVVLCLALILASFSNQVLYSCVFW